MNGPVLNAARVFVVNLRRRFAMRQQRRPSLLVEQLEDRTAPASYTLQPGGGDWEDMTSWRNNVNNANGVPQAGDTAIIPAGENCKVGDEAAAGTLIVNGGLDFTANVPDPSELTVDNLVANTGSVLDVSGKFTINNSGTFDVNSTCTVTDDAYIDSPNGLTFNGATLELNGGAVNAGTGSPVSLDQTSVLKGWGTISGDVSAAGAVVAGPGPAGQMPDWIEITGRYTSSASTTLTIYQDGGFNSGISCSNGGVFYGTLAVVSRAPAPIIGFTIATSNSTTWDRFTAGNSRPQPTFNLGNNLVYDPLPFNNDILLLPQAGVRNAKIGPVNPGAQASIDLTPNVTEYGPQTNIVGINGVSIDDNGGNSFTLPSGATVAISGTTLTYTAPLTPSNRTSDSFTFQVDTMDDSGTITALLNQPPTLSPIPDQAAANGGSKTFAVIATDPNLSDTNSTEVLSYALVSPPSGVWIDAGSGVVTLSPTQVVTNLTLTVTVTDSGGLTAIQAFNLTSYAFSALADNAATPSQTPVTISVLDNDAYSGSYQPAVRITGDPQYGTAALSSDGLSIVYTPGSTFRTGGDSLTYTITDANGGSSSTWVAITFKNTAPTGLALSNNTINASAAWASTIGTFSATDPDYGDSIIYPIVSDPSGLFRVAQDNGDLLYLTYSPAPGNYSIVVEAFDWYGYWDPGTYEQKTFTIHVT